MKHYDQHNISRVCRVLGWSRSSCYYVPQKNDEEIIAALLAKAEEHPREGFWKAHHRLRLEGYKWNHKRVHRVYVSIGLQLRIKKKKRKISRIQRPLEVPAHLNHTWSIDFVEDSLENGRKVRTFNVIDDANREALAIESNFSMRSLNVIWVLNYLLNRRGKPMFIRMDNGPEFIAKIMQTWSLAHGIEFIYIQPGKPTQNAYIERFNGSYRDGVLNAYLFETIDQLRDYNHQWIQDYNNHRPHESCRNLPPVMYAEKYLLA